MRRRRRLRVQAAITPRAAACSGRTLLTRNVSSRRPAIASATSSSARPSPYISAVSMRAAPRSSPSRSAAISSAPSPGFRRCAKFPGRKPAPARLMAVRPSSCDAAPPLLVSWTRPAGHCRKGFYSPWPGLCIGEWFGLRPGRTMAWPGGTTGTCRRRGRNVRTHRPRQPCRRRHAEDGCLLQRRSGNAAGQASRHQRSVDRGRNRPVARGGRGRFPGSVQWTENRVDSLPHARKALAPRAPAAPTCKVFGISLSGRRTSTDWSPPWRRPGSKC